MLTLIKRCSKCGSEKTTTEFCADKNRKDGLYPQCRSCVNEASRLRRQDPVRKQRERERRQIPEQVARRKEYYARYAQENKERRRAAYRKHRYGVDDAFLQAMLRGQKASCANPGCLAPITLAQAHVDHDRSCCPGRMSCGQCVRGLLCSGCNVGLGYFKDNPARLRGIAEYIERTQR